MAANRALARRGRDALCGALGVAAPAPDSMLGSMAAVPLPGIAVTRAAAERLQAELLEEDRIEVPVMLFPVRAAGDGSGPGAAPRPHLGAGVQPPRRVRRAGRDPREAGARRVRAAVAPRAAPPGLVRGRHRLGRRRASAACCRHPDPHVLPDHVGRDETERPQVADRRHARQVEQRTTGAEDRRPDVARRPRRRARPGGMRRRSPGRPPRAASRRRAARAHRAGPAAGCAHPRRARCGRRRHAPAAPGPAPPDRSRRASGRPRPRPGTRPSRCRPARRARRAAAAGRRRRGGARGAGRRSAPHPTPRARRRAPHEAGGHRPGRPARRSSVTCRRAPPRGRPASRRRPR